MTKGKENKLRQSEEDGMHHAYPAEFLQQPNAGGLPPALLCFKVGSLVILLRNLDPGEGLCNRTRMVVLNVRKKVLQCRIISKNRRFRGKVVLIPRIIAYATQETSIPSQAGLCYDHQQVSRTVSRACGD